MSEYLTLDKMNVDGRRVLVRADLNLPVSRGQVLDATRIARLAPTLLTLAQRRCKTIVMSHFGQPQRGYDPSLSLAQILPILEQTLGQPVNFASQCIGAKADAVVGCLPAGGYALLENLRFHPGEVANDPAFAQSLARHAEIYINDAFGVAHQAHASTDAITNYLPSAAGPLLQRELMTLESIFATPRRPLTALIGGAKFSTKLKILEALVPRVDVIVAGGLLANILLAANGSLAIAPQAAAPGPFDAVSLAAAQRLLALAPLHGCKLVLPVDLVVQCGASGAPSIHTLADGPLPADATARDIGPHSLELARHYIAQSRMVIWNGPFGAFEQSPFDTGTTALATFIAELTQRGNLFSVAGGGETVAALNQAKAGARFSYISSGGGAFLKWLEGVPFPVIQALIRSAKAHHHSPFLDLPLVTH